MYWNPSWGPHLSKYIMSYKKKKERTFSLGIDIFKNICMITVFYDFKFTRIMSFYLKSLQCLIQNTQSQGCWENVNNEEGTSWWYGHVCNDSSDKTLIFLFWKWCSTLGKTFNPAVCVVWTALVRGQHSRCKGGQHHIEMPEAALFLSLERHASSLCWASLMICSHLAGWHTDFFKGCFLPGKIIWWLSSYTTLL